VQISLIAASNRQPEWVEAAFADYAKRFSGPVRLQYTQIRLAKQPTPEKRKADEAERLLAAAPAGALLIALDETGRSWTTRDLADRLSDWMREGLRPCFLIGGPDGHGEGVFAAADIRLSLSALTLPHALARIIVAEALYRATSVLSGHPYHRD
jgi:23S rRNA (pseudouridine1915-N3)-methyltransferase